MLFSDNQHRFTRDEKCDSDYWKNLRFPAEEALRLFMAGDYYNLSRFIRNLAFNFAIPGLDHDIFGSWGFSLQAENSWARLERVKICLEGMGIDDDIREHTLFTKSCKWKRKGNYFLPQRPGFSLCICESFISPSAERGSTLLTNYISEFSTTIYHEIIDIHLTHGTNVTNLPGLWVPTEDLLSLLQALGFSKSTEERELKNCLSWHLLL